MNTYRISLAASLAALALSAPIAQGQACDKTFVDSTKFWHDGLAWSDGTQPTATQVACIPPGKIAKVYSNDAVAKAIVVQTDATDGPATLEIGRSWNLTISEDSTVDGELAVYGPVGLKLDGNLTISGTGFMKGESFVGVSDPIIDSSTGNDYTLTIGSGMRLEGLWDVKTKLVNHGTVVATTGTLKVSGGGDGTGVWAAETATGKLLITGGEIIGTGHWKLTDNAAATIQFDTSCDCLNGPVTITQGTFRVNQTFRTSGKLTINSGGQIKVLIGEKTAAFSVFVGPGCLPGGGGGGGSQ